MNHRSIFSLVAVTIHLRQSINSIVHYSRVWSSDWPLPRSTAVAFSSTTTTAIQLGRTSPTSFSLRQYHSKLDAQSNAGVPGLLYGDEDLRFLFAFVIFSFKDQRLEDLYHGRNSAAPPASADNFAHRRRNNHFSGSVDNPFTDLSFTLPTRTATTTSTYRGSWETQTPRRASSLFGPNPFASNTTTARSSTGDTRPILGGGGSNRERARPAETVPIVEEQEPAAGQLQRSNTFVLDEPSLPNLPQSGAQRPRDPVDVQELYNVRPRDRAQAPVAFTIDLNEAAATVQ